MVQILKLAGLILLGSGMASAQILQPANGGSGKANTATHKLGTANQDWSTLGTGIVKNTITTGAISDAVVADILALFSGSCTSSTFLRGDGQCAVATGSGITQLTGDGTAGPGSGSQAFTLNAQYKKGSCTEVWVGSGTSNALTAGDDAFSNNTCYNDSGVTRTITAVKCRSDVGSNTTTTNPTFGSAGTGTTILSGAVTCGSSLAYSSSGTVSNASWTTGTGINPVMSGTLTGTSIAMIVEYTF